jgi:hypothetical protein
MAEAKKIAVMNILEKENGVLDQVLAEQAKIRIAVTKKDWVGLQTSTDKIQKLTDEFVDLENKKELTIADTAFAQTPETAEATGQVRSKLIKSKVENKALGDYIRITKGFLQGVLDNVVPQRRNTLYSRKGTLVTPRPESVVIDQLF